eukprot:Lithocolla_globosa_v1_NODE_418_length_4113_cov_48.143420.p4 type:complete len:108 gc:universal NODE_418_length_4113_cov_48.143420:605-928(+)
MRDEGSTELEKLEGRLGLTFTTGLKLSELAGEAKFIPTVVLVASGKELERSALALTLSKLGLVLGRWRDLVLGGDVEDDDDDEDDKNEAFSSEIPLSSAYFFHSGKE